ncbi:hypothetical protein EEJ34_13820 [Vibrio cholerae]|nr:hypothetical protein EEJ34_13820 [Vibrio cholerae]
MSRLTLEIGTLFSLYLRFKLLYNARLRGWQRIPQNSNTPTVTTAAHWDWKRHALTVPLRRLLASWPIV